MINLSGEKAPIGRLSIDRLMWVMVPAMILTPFYTYYMGVSRHEVKPFPHATVTDTATHYPQDIVFRYVMLINSSFLSLTFFLVFRWLEWQAKRVGFPLPPSYQFYLAEASIICYAITIGTIDGKGIGKYHGPCAITFFVIWLVTILNMTVYMTRLRSWDTSVMSKTSLRLKQLLGFYVTGVWVYCLYNIIQENHKNKQDIYVVIVEWNSVIINLFWVLTLVLEWKHLGLSLVKIKNWFLFSINK